MALANLNDKSAWNEEAVLTSHLAGQLNRGRLALFLGAGVSQFFGLPSWRDLVNTISGRMHEPSLAPDADPLLRVAAIREKHFKNNTPRFLLVVRDALYENVDGDFEKLRLNTTLSAIGSLVMASRRGSASQVVTLNYDDLLETYLEYHGFFTASVFSSRHWRQNADTVIYHPHGYLPRTHEVASEDIVFGTDDFLKILRPDTANLWRPLLETLMRTHTVIYIGLSGADLHLQSLLAPLSEFHAIQNDRIAYHGVRFGLKFNAGDDVSVNMEKWGVYTHLIDQYDQIAPFLFKICQDARVMRVSIEG